MLEMKEMWEALYEGKPILHDGRWAMATLEVGSAIVQSGRTLFASVSVSF